MLQFRVVQKWPDVSEGHNTSILRVDGSTWHMLVCCILLFIVYDPEDRDDILPKPGLFPSTPEDRMLQL